MPVLYVTPLVPVEVKRLAKDKSGTIPEVLELAESDGTIRRWNILLGKDGATEIAIAVEATGEQKIVDYGKQAGGAIEAILLNGDRAQVVEIDGFKTDRRVADAVAITSSLADVWDPNALYSLDNTAYLDVELFISNITPSTDGVLKFIGKDLQDAGTIDDIWAAEIPMPAGEVGKALGIFRIGGDDVIMAQADANSVLQLHIRIAEEGTAV